MSSPLPWGYCPSPGGDQGNASSSDEDVDTLRRLVQNFCAKPGDFRSTGGNSGDDLDSCSDAESSASEDVAYLRRLQEKFSDVADSGAPSTPPIVNPIRSFPPPDTDDEEDFETLRAIQRRFAHYSDATPKDFSPEITSVVSTETYKRGSYGMSLSIEMNEETQHQGHTGLRQDGEESSSLFVFSKFADNYNDVPKVVQDNVPVLPDASLRNTSRNEENSENNHSNLNQMGNVLSSLSMKPCRSLRVQKSVQDFVNAIKKNRSYQRFIREKLMEIEAKIEANGKLKERIKCVMDFHAVCRRKICHNLYQKRDPRVRLISLPKQRSSRTAQEYSRSSPLHFAPAENLQVSNYRMIMERYPVLLRKRQWTNTETDKLAKGVKQQYQEMLFLNSVNFGNDFCGSIDSIIMSTFGGSDQVTPQTLRSFLPLVNWDRLASMYLPRHSGPACESRWLNHDDPMINHNPWTAVEDKKLLFTVQERGIYNWIDIAIALHTQRTPFQCLARYQRSLNPHILNRVWTNEEDAKLSAAVATFGDKSWQIVASHLDGRTSNQCSVRWRNTLLPERKRVGRWSVEEDKRLKVAVILFGAKNWKKLAQFIEGRTQSQCRERWLNCLDPCLNLERWTKEEDAKLLAAIEEHGHSWSKVAVCVPRRTDNQCRRRWKVLLPHEVPILRVAHQLKRTVLISNFVGRKCERPAIGPDDFIPLKRLPAHDDTENYLKVGKKRSREQSNRKVQRNVSSKNVDAMESGCCKRTRKIASRVCRPKMQKRPLDELLTSGELSEDALMELPLVDILKRMRVCRPKTQKRPLDVLLTSGELSEDALMELPLVDILKLMSKKARTIDHKNKRPTHKRRANECKLTDDMMNVSCNDILENSMQHNPAPDGSASSQLVQYNAALPHVEPAEVNDVDFASRTGREIPLERANGAAIDS